ncbi:hypothetical protein PGT21_035255 [Puccinia graminis f. sp. tritici]|uniref:Uncharacterized protein n=1 Tax=Puccinia graminis f. sp. tritici TaxID=56615 RepID=A0A5B0PCD4_PUCGR|nr:hypothetical protein PGT21_035255 [Puccinia graminis f. sp. tritici]
MELKLHPLNPSVDHSCSLHRSGLSALPNNPSDNPFNHFKILDNEQLPEERDQTLLSSGKDKIDSLQDSSEGYFRPPDEASHHDLSKGGSAAIYQIQIFHLLPLLYYFTPAEMVGVGTCCYEIK